MDDIIRNLAPPAAGLLLLLYVQYDVRRMRKERHGSRRDPAE